MLSSSIIAQHLYLIMIGSYLDATLIPVIAQRYELWLELNLSKFQIGSHHRTLELFTNQT
jgi:hypothetical protein